MFTVYYCIGGTLKFEWRKCVPVGTRDEAISQVEGLKRMGYSAHYAETRMLDIVGLPDTYE